VGRCNALSTAYQDRPDDHPNLAETAIAQACRNQRPRSAFDVRVEYSAVFNLVSAKLWWIVGCSLSAILPTSAPSAQESTPARASPEEVNAPWDDLLSVLRKSPIRGDQQNRARSTEQPDDSPAREFQPDTAPDRGEPDASRAVPPADGAPTSLPTRQRVLEKKTSGQPAQFTRPRREKAARAPELENHRGRDRQVPSSASPGEAAAASTQSSRLKRSRPNEPELPAAAVPAFPRSLIPSSAAR
jgi:hypothetical protein